MKTALYINYIKTALLGFGIVIAVCAVFVLPKTVLAADTVLVEQTDASTESNHQTNAQFTQELGTGLQGRVKAVNFVVSSDTGTQDRDFFAEIVCYDDAYSTLCNGGVSDHTFTTTIQTKNISTSATNITINFDDLDLDLDSTKYYLVRLTFNGWASVGGSIFGSNTDTYASGAASGTGIGSVDDLYFQLYIEGPVYFANPPFEEGMTTTDFTYWRYCINPIGLTFTSAQVKIQYGDILSDFEDTAPALDYWGTSVKCETFAKVEDLTPDPTYVARVNLYLDSSPFESSEILNFSVVDGEKSIYPINLGTSSEDQETCVQGNIVTIGFCQVTQFLFVPSDSTLDNLSNEFDEIKTKFPFAYVTDVTSAAEGISEGTETTGLELTSEVGDVSFSFDILDKDNIETYAGDGTIGIFRELTGIAMYAAFGLFVFHSVRTLH